MTFSHTSKLIEEKIKLFVESQMVKIMKETLMMMKPKISFSMMMVTRNWYKVGGEKVRQGHLQDQS